jgi:ribose transport system substrate-binding protein
MQLLDQFCWFLARRFCLSAISPFFRSFYSNYPVAKLRKPGKEGIWKEFGFLSPKILSGLLCASFLLAGTQRAFPASNDSVTLAISIRTLSNPYQANYKVGAEAFGKLVGLPVDVLTTEANSEKGLTDIKSEVARTGGNVVFFIDPNQATDDVAIAKILDRAGVYFVTWWNKPADVKVWDYPHWVAHISFDGVAAGYYTANELFKTFKNPGQGKIVALQGLLANTPAAERFQGLQKAISEKPGVQLVQWVAADWDRTKAYNDTKAMLIAHPDIDGVWCANDDMAMGSIQALKEAGLAGKVLVTGTDGIGEMFDAIKSGLAAATVMNDAKYQAGLGLAMSLAAKQGKLDVASQPQKYRQFEIPAVNVNRENVDQIVKEYITNTPQYDFSNFYARWSVAIP